MDKELRDKEIIETEEITRSPIQAEQEKSDFQQKEKKDNFQSGKSSVKIGIVERPRGSSVKGRMIWEKEIVPPDNSDKWSSDSKIVEAIDDKAEIGKYSDQDFKNKEKKSSLSKEEVERLERGKKQKDKEKKETHELSEKNSKLSKTTPYAVGLLVALLGIGTLVFYGKN
jgi:hypothetical protein